MMNGVANTHKYRYWSDINPQSFKETHTQHPHNLLVWAGILGNQILAPLFIDGKLNRAIHLEILENIIDSMITEIVGNDHLLEDKIMVQQVGAPSLYAVQVREFLNERFSSKRVSLRGAMNGQLDPQI